MLQNIWRFLKFEKPANRHFHTDRHHVQWCLVFSCDGTLISTTPHYGSGIVYKQRVVATKRGFRQQLQRLDAPSRNILLQWVSKWRQEGSVEGSKPRGRPFSARTPDNVGPVMDMLRRPGRSARRQALALRLKEISVCRILQKVLHYHPYKIQVARKLSERGKVSRLELCSELGKKR